MKKKTFLLILAILLVVCLVGVMVACGDDNGQTQTADNGQTQTGDNGQTQTGDNGQTQTGDNGNTGVDTGSQGGNESGSQGGIDSGSQGGNESGSQGGSQSGSQTTLTKALPSAQAIVSAIGETYKISAQGLYDNYSQTAASDGTYFLSPAGTFSKKTGENQYHNYGNMRDGKYTSLSSPNYFPEDSLGTIVAQETVGKILQFAGETISYQSEEALTFAGRAAKKYTYDGQNVYGYDTFHEEIVIDDLTGACLKYDNLGRAGDGFTGGTRNKAGFQVTEFFYGENNAQALAVINEYKAKIDVYEWDTAFMTAVGLSAVDAPAWEFWEAYWDHRTTRESDYPELEMSFRYYTEDPDGTEEDVRDFIQSFYAAGAKLNEYGTQQTFADLCSYDEDYRSFDMWGYIVGNEEYQVYINAEHNARISPKAWRVTIRITKPEE